MIEDLRIGAPVRASSGKHLGKLARVVVDGKSNRVVSLVVDPGLVESGNLLAPGGWERPRERVVVVDQVASAAPDLVTLAIAEDAFDQLPLFEHERFVSVATAAADEGGAEAGQFEAGELLNYTASGFGLGGAYLPPAEITHDEPASAGAIAAGTEVWRVNVDPHERIGEVERVLVDGATQRVSGLVLRRGLLRHHVVLPIALVSGVEDDVVHVRLNDDELKALAPFAPES
jgi:sporulation protein YlmC with PRC-barrel domain